VRRERTKRRRGYARFLSHSPDVLSKRRGGYKQRDNVKSSRNSRFYTAPSARTKK